ncbi:MAG: hypothetical protein ABI680_19390, partial [Chthoniobacteraceae bacterium]
MTEIKFECTHCRQRLLVNGDAAGLEVTCPGCASKLRVPFPAAVADYVERTAKSAVSGNGVGLAESVDLDAEADGADLRQECLDARAEIRRLQTQLAEA